MVNQKQLKKLISEMKDLPTSSQIYILESIYGKRPIKFFLEALNNGKRISIWYRLKFRVGHIYLSYRKRIIKYYADRRLKKWKIIFEEIPGLSPEWKTYSLKGTGKKEASDDVAKKCKDRSKSLIQYYYKQRDLIKDSRSEALIKWIAEKYIG